MSRSARVLRRFVDRVAVVTGAASGIGQAVARQLVEEGAWVAAVDWHPEDAEEAFGDLTGAARLGSGVIVLGADVTSASDVDGCISEVLTRFGRIDVLVNSAGIVEGDDILAIEPETWDRNVESVLTSVYLCIRTTLPSMVANRRGAIVNIASVNGLSALGDDAYSAAKAGVINLTKSVAVRYGAEGVRCNAVAPADVRTPRWEARLRDDPRLLDHLARWYPLQRIGEPGDIAAATLFLASDEASWITGIVLTVDGGLLAGNHQMMAEMYPAPRR